MEPALYVSKGRLRRRPRILLAEDDYELRRMVAAVLRHDGYEVTEVATGEQLLSYMLAGHRNIGFEEPDLILSDVCMPGQSGLDVLAQLRTACVSTPVVLMTAYPDEVSNSRALELGAIALLSKPVDLDDLRMVVLNIAAPSEPPNRGSRS